MIFGFANLSAPGPRIVIYWDCVCEHVQGFFYRFLLEADSYRLNRFAGGISLFRSSSTQIALIVPAHYMRTRVVFIFTGTSVA